MPKHPSAITGSAGEHLVAGRLAAMGYVVALTRGGSPTADLLVTNQKGDKTLSVQVKTSVWAGRWQSKNPAKNHWEWPFSARAAELTGDTLLYALVDLQNWPDQKGSMYQVFIVPSKVVAASVKGILERERPRIFHWIMESEKATYHERWDRIEAILGKTPAG